MATIISIKGAFYNNAFKNGVKFIETRSQVIKNKNGKTYQKIGETIYFYNSDTKQVEYKGRLSNIINNYDDLSKSERENVDQYGLHYNLFLIFNNIEILEKPLKPANVYQGIFTETTLTETDGIITRLIEKDEEFQIINAGDGHIIAKIPQYWNRDSALELAEKMQNAIWNLGSVGLKNPTLPKTLYTRTDILITTKYNNTSRRN